MDDPPTPEQDALMLAVVVAVLIALFALGVRW